ncbi:MAG: HD domain-containing phosphohydrolase [bacterium]
MLAACAIRDVGTISIPEVILLKSDKLDYSEWTIMKDHTKVGRNLVLQTSTDLKDIAESVYYHHERWDGEGYPEGLKGDQIPLMARIIAVIDTYCAMIQDRPYRKALSDSEALKQIKEGSNIYFDPKIVDLFIEAFIEYKSTEDST